MGVQSKVTANLDAETAAMLDEMHAEEPLTTKGGLMSWSLRITYREWHAAGRDLKRVLSPLSPHCGDRKPPASELSARKARMA